VASNKHNPEIEQFLWTANRYIIGWNRLHFVQCSA